MKRVCATAYLTLTLPICRSHPQPFLLPNVLHRVFGVVHRVLGVLHRVVGVLHRVVGVLHKALGVLHRVVGVLHRVAEEPPSAAPAPYAQAQQHSFNLLLGDVDYDHRASWLRIQSEEESERALARQTLVNGLARGQLKDLEWGEEKDRYRVPRGYHTGY